MVRGILFLIITKNHVPPQLTERFIIVLLPWNFIYQISFFLIFVCFGDCLILYVCNYSSLITAWIQVDKLQFCLGVDIEIRSHRCSVSHKVFGLKFKCYSISREYIIREPHFYFGVANCCFCIVVFSFLFSNQNLWYFVLNINRIGVEYVGVLLLGVNFDS